MAPVANVFEPETPGSPGGGATGGVVNHKAVTLDLSGSAGVIANNTVIGITVRDPSGNAIGTAAGLITGVAGASTFVYLIVYPGAGFFPKFSPQDDTVGITVGTSSAITWGEESCGVAISRTSNTGSPSGQLYDIRGSGTTDRSFGATMTGATSVFESGQTTYDPRSFGIISTPGSVTTLRSTTDYGTTLFTPADLADGLRVATEIPNGTAEIDYAAVTNAFFIGINRFVGTGATTATQDANGITLANGSFSFPLERIHVHVMGDY